MLEASRDGEDVVTRLAAVAQALDEAGFAIVAGGLHQCLAGGDGIGVRRSERLFLSLA